MSHDFSTDVGKRCLGCGLVFATVLLHSCRGANSAADQSEREAAVAKESVVADSSELVGAALGERYKIIKPLGKGGIGGVCLAQHTLLNSLLPARSLLSDYGILSDGCPYIIMEFQQGPKRRDLLERSAMDPLLACCIGTQSTFALQTVHDKGMVHRDRFPASRKLVGSFQLGLFAVGFRGKGWAKSLLPDGGYRERIETKYMV